ncbi:DUF5955 family protein [Streptomyces sp. 4N509B]|uniref:DUF5955 family protein n=1 Tax=Streptomyces sp. 4N509B TaxID=3457413 RepID=UPI003FD5C405
MSALRAAVDRLRGELGDYRAVLADREVAERALASMERMCEERVPDLAVLRDALLLVAAAVGSVRVLSPALGELRATVELLGVERERVPEPRPVTR